MGQFVNSDVKRERERELMVVEEKSIIMQKNQNLMKFGFFFGKIESDYFYYLMVPTLQLTQ